ncbi:calcium-binding protein, partial [Methylobacterium sp.]|uniref:calcium-binding protein n=1 Tax=Methylobacterium sp. TaxID=409 RepID=UPI0025CED33C
ITGGRGDDTIYGNAGNDTYRYARGDGNDILDDGNTFGGTADKLVLAGINPNAISLERSGDDVTLIIAPSTPGGTDGGWVTLARQVDAYWEKGIEQVVFADGTVWSAQDLRQKVADQAGWIRGTDGSDTLNGSSANDIIDGKAGNDYLSGRLGDDTYIFGRGYGRDTIDDEGVDAGPSADRVSFSAGISSTDVHFARSGNDLLVTINDTSDQLTIKDGLWSIYNNPNFGRDKVELFEFADGNRMNLDEVMLLI